jgi:hypothetical protein
MSVTGNHWNPIVNVGVAVAGTEMKTLKPGLDQVRVSRVRRTDIPLSGYSILIVEDEPLIALNVNAAKH